MNSPTAPAILYAEDDPDDRLLAEMAHRASGVANPLMFVGEGVELLEYLRCTGRHADRSGAPQPGVILLDLNMPGMGGLEALRIMRADSALRRIPVVILTTSTAAEDVSASYDAGANSYMVKPSAFAGLVGIFERLCGDGFGSGSLGTRG